MLEQIKIDHPDTQVIILTAHDSLNNAIESIQARRISFYQASHMRRRNCLAW